MMDNNPNVGDNIGPDGRLGKRHGAGDSPKIVAIEIWILTSDISMGAPRTVAIKGLPKLNANDLGGNYLRR
jgi:hypothetical protein